MTSRDDVPRLNEPPDLATAPTERPGADVAAPSFRRGREGLPTLVDDDPEVTEAGPLLGRALAGRYLVLREVAEGGMATVYVAKDQRTGAQVAVKVMLPDLTRERGFGIRFKREAAIAARLDHPGIVRVLDHGTEGRSFFLVMELLDGADIFSVLLRQKRLDAATARRVMIEVCEALAVAHEQNIVHRDLKPENVFLRRAGETLVVKVLDFGVAKMVLPDDRADDAETGLTAVGTLLGTPEYLSPEMCLGEPVGPPADIYACGVLLYALLTGRPPFVTERPIDVTHKHIGEEPLPPSWFLPGLDPALDAIVLKALAKRPDERHPSARALADELRALGPVDPLPASLLPGADDPAPQKHAPDGVTLAVPNAARAAVAEADGDEAARTEAAPPEPAEPALDREPGPPTTRAGGAPAAGLRTVTLVVAVVALGASFAAGFVAGRASGPPCPPVVSPAR